MTKRNSRKPAPMYPPSWYDQRPAPKCSWSETTDGTTWDSPDADPWRDMWEAGQAGR